MGKGRGRRARERVSGLGSGCRAWGEGRVMGDGDRAMDLGSRIGRQSWGRGESDD